ncbi:hypothetical protein CFIICLFH_4072 [Methylobacterium goesingense]|nr:hypothetical protein CFIICLFH_4072 [Methylobacterium goesingense]
MPSAVATSKVTPPAGAGALRETVKVRLVWPAWPSVTCASAIDRAGRLTAALWLDTAMSSMPTHSSLPTAFAVMMRTWRPAAPFASDGSVTLTGVTCVALPCVVASATYPAGRFFQAPASIRYWTATGWIALSVEPSMSRALKATTTSRRPVASR